jgi:hypothetical protein
MMILKFEAFDVDYRERTIGEKPGTDILRYTDFLMGKTVW